jgi:hypothetical protein
LQKVLQGGCHTAIIGPEGNHLCPPITEGEGMAIADLDFSIITKRKRMMDSVGHYARPDLLQLQINQASRTSIDIHQERLRTHPDFHNSQSEPLMSGLDTTFFSETMS